MWRKNCEEEVWASKFIAVVTVIVLALAMPVPVGGADAGPDVVATDPPMIIYPSQGEIWSGINMIAWTGYKDMADSWAIYCDSDGISPYDYTIDGAYNPNPEDPNQDENWTYTWNTNEVTDGHWYIVIMEVGPYSFGAVPGVSGRFLINNVNEAPEAPLDPVPADGTTNVEIQPTLRVRVLDPDGDNLTVRFYNAADNSLIATVYNVSSNGTASVEWLEVNVFSEYSWYAEADDGEFTNRSETWSFDTMQPYGRDMMFFSAPGWVLMSFPYDISGCPSEVLDDSVYGDAGTTWSVAKSYDNMNKKWITHRLGSPFNTFNHVDNTMGIWLHITSNGGDMTLTTGKTGEPPAGATITLYAGWNLIGYPSMTDRLADDVFFGCVDIMSTYKPTPPYVEDYPMPADVLLSHGNAYWVHCTADCTISIGP